jgi:hypothetical protein
VCSPAARRTGDRQISAGMVDGGWRRPSLEPLTGGVPATSRR